MMRLFAWRWMGVDSFSGTPSSLRRARMVTMRSCMVFIALAAMGSTGKSVGCGYRVRAMDFAGGAPLERALAFASVAERSLAVWVGLVASGSFPFDELRVRMTSFEGVGAKLRRSLT